MNAAQAVGVMVVSVVVGEAMGGSLKLHPSPSTYRPHYNTPYTAEPHHAPAYPPKPTYATKRKYTAAYTPKPTYAPPLYSPKPTYTPKPTYAAPTKPTYTPVYTPAPTYSPKPTYTSVHSPKSTYSSPAYTPSYSHDEGHHYHNEPTNYDFGYGVSDKYHGTTFGHSEKRDGYRTEGQYFVDLPDGRRMVVTYYSDDTGYHPTITYEGAPTYPAHPLPYNPKPVHKPLYSPKPHVYKPRTTYKPLYTGP